MTTMTPASPAAATAPTANPTSAATSTTVDCWPGQGPTAADAAVRAAAARQESDAHERERLWGKGFNRRRFLAGGLGVGVAALGSQLATTRVAYAAPGTATGTLVVLFLRGGMDGLSFLVPGADPDLPKLRPGIAVPAGRLLPLDRGFGLHPSMAPLTSLINAGQVAVVPAISTPDLSRSHFQAQDCLERGGAATGTQTGWLDRVLEVSGPGTTFRSVAVGGLMPRSLTGTHGSISFGSLARLRIDGSGDAAWSAATSAAIQTLYTGVADPVAAQAMLGIDAVTTAARLAVAGGGTTVTYPKGAFADSLKDVATLIKKGTGVRVACIDVGGWDMHTALGTTTSGDMMSHVGQLASGLAAFATDLGPLLDSTTVVTMSEFGRRVEQNASGGVDHGHGGVSLVIGGGVKGGVKGRWEGLTPAVLKASSGDVPGSNDYRDLLSEVVGARLQLTTGALQSVFPGWRPTALGLMA